MKLILQTIAGVAVLASSAFISTAVAGDAGMMAKGKELAFNRKKGNCLSCHMMDDGKLPGSAGPPLIGMKARFPKKSDMSKQIWDASIKNPLTPMPPFGRHEILSKKEFDLVVDYVYSL